MLLNDACKRRHRLDGLEILDRIRTPQRFRRIQEDLLLWVDDLRFSRVVRRTRRISGVAVPSRLHSWDGESAPVVPDICSSRGEGTYGIDALRRFFQKASMSRLRETIMPIIATGNRWSFG
jgi:hypothetical protein